jgi:hypothetical protein
MLKQSNCVSNFLSKTDIAQAESRLVSSVPLGKSFVIYPSTRIWGIRSELYREIVSTPQPVFFLILYHNYFGRSVFEDMSDTFEPYSKKSKVRPICQYLGFDRRPESTRGFTKLTKATKSFFRKYGPQENSLELSATSATNLAQKFCDPDSPGPVLFAGSDMATENRWPTLPNDRDL